MFKTQKIILLFSFFIFISFGKALSIEPDVFVQSVVNRAADTLGGNLNKEDRIEELKKIASETVDIRGIGFYSLGSHRKNISEDQKKEYERVFTNYFLIDKFNNQDQNLVRIEAQDLAKQ